MDEVTSESEILRGQINSFLESETHSEISTDGVLKLSMR